MSTRIYCKSCLVCFIMNHVQCVEDSESPSLSGTVDADANANKSTNTSKTNPRASIRSKNMNCRHQARIVQSRRENMTNAWSSSKNSKSLTKGAMQQDETGHSIMSKHNNWQIKQKNPPNNKQTNKKYMLMHKALQFTFNCKLTVKSIKCGFCSRRNISTNINILIQITPLVITVTKIVFDPLNIVVEISVISTVGMISQLRCRLILVLLTFEPFFNAASKKTCNLIHSKKALTHLKLHFAFKWVTVM